jgi:hypothetical protein
LPASLKLPPRFGMLIEMITVILAIYVDSYLFIFLTALVARGMGINEYHSMCSGAIYLCMGIADGFSVLN